MRTISNPATNDAFANTNGFLRFFASPPTSGPSATLAIRLMAGCVFFWEGLLKFAYVNQGVGRFTKLGIPVPDVLAPAIAVLEIAGGLLVMSGLFTRFITVPFIIEMIVAMLSTKIALYLGTSPLPLPPSPPKIGTWAVLHEIRSEYAQLMSCVFLLAAGPGPWSLDALLARRRSVSSPQAPTELHADSHSHSGEILAPTR